MVRAIHPVIEAIEAPHSWRALVGYLVGRWLVRKPTPADAEQAMAEMLVAIRTTNCRRDQALEKVLADEVTDERRSAMPLIGPSREFNQGWQILTSIARCIAYEQSAPNAPEGGFPVSSSLNVQLTDALRKYVDERASDKDVYATPSEYIRDLIRQDMQDHAVATKIFEGLDDVRKGPLLFAVDSRRP